MEYLQRELPKKQQTLEPSFSVNYRTYFLAGVALSSVWLAQGLIKHNSDQVARVNHWKKFYSVVLPISLVGGLLYPVEMKLWSVCSAQVKFWQLSVFEKNDIY